MRNSLVFHRMDKKLKQIEVEVVSIDTFVEEKGIKKVDFIKIDAEGFELDVLKGADRTLSTSKPKMVLWNASACTGEKGR